MTKQEVMVKIMAMLDVLAKLFMKIYNWKSQRALLDDPAAPIASEERAEIEQAVDQFEAAVKKYDQELKKPTKA